MGVAAFVGRTERQFSARQATLREFDLLAHDAFLKIADAGSAQQAYVAAGQSARFWVPQVAALLPEAGSVVDRLRTLASSETSRRTLLEASAALTELSNIDRRARDYLAAEQPLMAADVVFSEGRETATAIARLVESARLADRQESDALEAAARRREAAVASSAAGFAGLVLLWLGAIRSPSGATEAPTVEMPASDIDDTLHLRDAPAVQETTPRRTADVADSAALALEAAAQVCTEFGCVQSTADLRRVLTQAASVIDASGLIVWLGSTAGADLRPVVAHGYSEQVLSLMRAVPRQADNAAAAAYRTGALQIVPAKPGTSLGAVVAPLISADGCIGALTAEIRDNGEVSETVHAVAAIFASQLAGVLASSAQVSSTGAKAAAS